MCVSVTLSVEHANRKRLITRILQYVTYLSLPYFSRNLINGTNFGKMLFDIKSVFWFSPQLLPEIFIILRRIQRDMIINVHGYSSEVTLFLSYFKESWILRTDFREKIYSNIKFREKSLQWKPIFSHADTERERQREGQGHAEANIFLLQFAKAP